MNLAVTEVAPFAVYTPSASSDNPPAAAKVLSQSVTRAFRPVPITEPAVLCKNKFNYLNKWLRDYPKLG